MKLRSFVKLFVFAIVLSGFVINSEVNASEPVTSPKGTQRLYAGSGNLVNSAVLETQPNTGVVNTTATLHIERTPDFPHMQLGGGGYLKRADDGVDMLYLSQDIVDPGQTCHLERTETVDLGATPPTMYLEIYYWLGVPGELDDGGISSNTYYEISVPTELIPGID